MQRIYVLEEVQHRQFLVRHIQLRLTVEAMVYILYDASYFSDFTCPSVMFQYFRVLELHLVSFLNSFLCTGEVVLDVLFKNACSTSAYKISLDDYIVPYKRENIIH